MWDTFRQSRTPKTAKAERRRKAKSPTPKAVLRKLAALVRESETGLRCARERKVLQEKVFEEKQVSEEVRICRLRPGVLVRTAVRYRRKSELVGCAMVFP